MIDHTDKAILALLKENSRRQWKEIGETVHLTGQAVAARVQAMLDRGVIEAFTLRVDSGKLGKPLRAFVTVFMASSDHSAFQRFLAGESRITEAHRIGGDGCYWFSAELATQEDLNQLLEQVLRFGNYRIQLSIGRIK
ncbi:MAG TPA: AsnC family transcriptional regulator [Selenomonadales bacterium]|nr:AsnC family transcriptional regulator [Selenomonadales bacterium]